MALTMKRATTLARNLRIAAARPSDGSAFELVLDILDPDRSER